MTSYSPITLVSCPQQLDDDLLVDLKALPGWYPIHVDQRLKGWHIGGFPQPHILLYGLQTVPVEGGCIQHSG